jgi:hypothetical protein
MRAQIVEFQSWLTSALFPVRATRRVGMVRNKNYYFYKKLRSEKGYVFQ